MVIAESVAYETGFGDRSWGAGKSTFARQLGKALDIKVNHLDSAYWRSGWSKPSEDEWLQTVNQLVSGDAWILDLVVKFRNFCATD
jgi:adenylate kinase family enzyme